MSFLSSQQQSDAKRYKGGSENLSYKELKFAGWYIRNKTKLANVGIGALLVFCIITVGYSLVMWVGYLAVGMQNAECRCHHSFKIIHSCALSLRRVA